MYAMVETARGPIPGAALGRTLMHEHLFVLSTEVTENWPDSWGNEDERVESAAAQLDELKTWGYDTFRRLQRRRPPNVERQRRVAELTDMNIIVATGFYTYRDLPFQLEGKGPGLPTEARSFLHELFIRDIEVGGSLALVSSLDSQMRK